MIVLERLSKFIIYRSIVVSDGFFGTRVDFEKIGATGMADVVAQPTEDQSKSIDI